MLVAATSAAGRGGRCGEDDRQATHETNAGEHSHTRIACSGGKGGVH
jgi:hypothetical protein